MWLPKRLMGPEAVLMAASHCARIREIMVQLHWKLHTQLLESTGNPVGRPLVDPFARTYDKASKGNRNYCM